MIKFCIKNIKGNHTLCDYIKRNCGIFCEYNEQDYDFVIISMDCYFTEQGYPRIFEEVKSKGKKYFLYSEHSGCLLDGNFDQDDLCCGYLAHIRETQNILKGHYKKPVYYLPIGTDEIDQKKVKERIDNLTRKDKINLLFWGSWNDINQGNFIGRGGRKIDEICCRLGCDVKLNIRSPITTEFEYNLPENVNRWVNYVPYEELVNIHLDSDFLLLPAAQVHAISIPFAFSFGLPVLGNTTFGMSDFLTPGYNSIVFPEDTFYIKNCVKELKKLINDRESLIKMSINALKSWQDNYNSKNYDLSLYQIFRNHI